MSSDGREKLDKLKGKVFYLFPYFLPKHLFILPNSVNKTILGINVMSGIQKSQSQHLKQLRLIRFMISMLDQ